MMRRAIAGGLALAALGLAVPGQAREWVYSPIVEEGQKGIEYYADWGEGSDGVDNVGHELSARYALGPRDQVALYGVWRGRRSEVDAVQQNVEWIHQVFRHGEHTWDVGTYLAYQVRDNGPPQAIELKALLERAYPRTTLTLNPVFLKELGADAGGVQVGYAARLALRDADRVRPALELYGELGDTEDLRDWPETLQLLGPVADLRLGSHLLWQMGVLWGLTKDSDNVRLKTQVTVEWN